MKKEYDLSKMKMRKNPYIGKKIKFKGTEDDYTNCPDCGALLLKDKDVIEDHKKECVPDVEQDNS